MKSFGTWLAEELDRRNWSMGELGRRCDVDRTAILRVVNGERKPSSDLCKRVAHAFDVSEQEVLIQACELDVTLPEAGHLEEIKYLFIQLTNEEQEEILAQMRAMVEKKLLG